MPYLDRLRECAYTDPNGTVHSLRVDDSERSGGKKLGEFSLPQQDRDEFQDLGNGATRYPFDCYIVGEDYDIPADAFWDALNLRYRDDKPGVLAHPRWGDIPVKPLTFAQSEGHVDGMGAARFQVTFVRVDPSAKFPTTTANAAGAIESASDATALTTIAAYIGPTTAADIAIVTQGATDALHSLQNQLASVVAVSDELAAALDSGVTQAVDGIADLVAAPATMAETITGLMRLPASAAGSISQKLVAYSSLFDSLATSAGFRSQADNDLLSLNLSASALAAAEACTTGDLLNRADAVAASDSIAALLAYYRSMMDLTGPNAQMVADTVGLLTTAQAYLLEASFGLKSARRRILDHDSDPITETWTAYRDVSMLDQFCKDNALADGEFFVLPIGREIVWYA